MKVSFLCISFFCASIFQLQAQKELLNPLVDSKEVIAKGMELHDVGKFKAAIEEYLKVAPSDTNYSTIINELILSYYRDSNFVAAEKYGNLGLSLYPHKNTEWYGLLADVYDDTKRKDLAIKAYDTILAQNPYSYLTYFNKGITLFRDSLFDKAEDNFKQCLILNPYYSSAHYFLGQLALRKGNMVQALLSFTANLIVSPGNSYQKNTINFLSTIAEVNTTATEYLQKYKPGKQDNFDDMQEILVSKIALDKKYKLKADLEDHIVRQLQVVMEKLEYNANDKGFWMQYYVPLYKSVWDNDYFEPMVFHMFSELDIKKVKDYQKKEKRKIESFSNAASTYLNSIRESQELVFNKRADAQPRYYIKNYVVNGKGGYGKNEKNEVVLTGAWEFYYPNGRIRSKGVFNNDGLRNGDWQYYYENGILKEITKYSNSEVNGKSLSWYDNGLAYTISTYANDKLEGEETTYFFSGMLSSIVNYKAGKKEGIAKYYSVDGYLQTVANYSNDKQEGEETVYYSNGKVKSVTKYEKDLPVGECREYFDKGELKIKGNFAEGKKTGPWNNYFKDSKPETVSNYVNGELDGDWVSYYENGKISSKRFFRKGEADGKEEDFDDDGIVYSETIFERGRLRDIKFFDKKGTIISNTTSRKGNANISFYGPDGVKTSEGYYSKDGLAEGKFTYYYKNGKISTDCSYKSGMLEDKRTLYYADSKLREEGNYKADKADGYFINYYNNGQVSGEGWYVDGDRQGTFINYDLLGNITSKVYYLNDAVHGITEYYTPAGKLGNKDYYDNGWFNKIEQYDSTGKLMITSELSKGEGKVHFDHFNGKPYFESNYKHYKLHGAYTVNNGDGSKSSVSYYKNGSRDSVYTAWYTNGQVNLEGNYDKGNKTGTWKYYHRNGKLLETELYKDGELDGVDKQYDESGAIEREIMYKDGELDGENKFYGDGGQLMLVFYYKKGTLLGYSYEDKTGKLVPMIPLVNGAGIVDSYYKNGVKSAHMKFNEGVVDGERILYYSNGKEHVVSSRINGLDNGIRKEYYPSGKIMKEENYYYDERHGSFKYYNENGTLMSDENYYLGELHGECKYYTAGKLSQTYIYYYDVLESKK